MRSRLDRDESRRRRKRGKNAELDLVQVLQQAGWQCKRSAMSGLGRNSPDVEATKESCHVAIEVKSARTKRSHVNLRQISKLADSLDFYGHYPNKVALAAFKFPYHPWILRLIPPDELMRIKEKARPLEKEAEELQIKMRYVKTQEERNDMKRRRAILVSYLNEPVVKVTRETKSTWLPSITTPIPIASASQRPQT